MIRAIHLLTGRIGWYCEHISDACRNCYAEQTNKGFFQLGTKLPYKPQSRDQVKIYLDEETLTQPLRWKRPRKIFVCSMTDIFGHWVSDEWIDRIFAVMALSPHHTFQVLTKRPQRMLEYMLEPERKLRVLDAVCRIGINYSHIGSWLNKNKRTWGYFTENWPLPHIWLGVTAEDQKTAVQRIPLLLLTPAAVRFISAEPLLGPIDLTTLVVEQNTTHRWGWDALTGEDFIENFTTHQRWEHRRTWRSNLYSHVNWVIVGGESGSGSRPMHPDWAHSLRVQCRDAQVAFHFKQWGEYAHWQDIGTYDVKSSSWIHPDWFHLNLPGVWVEPDGRIATEKGRTLDAEFMYRVGKHRAGRRLDGREWDAFPK